MRQSRQRISRLGDDTRFQEHLVLSSLITFSRNTAINNDFLPCILYSFWSDGRRKRFTKVPSFYIFERFTTKGCDLAYSLSSKCICYLSGGASRYGGRVKSEGSWLFLFVSSIRCSRCRRAGPSLLSYLEERYWLHSAFWVYLANWQQYQETTA